MRRGTVVRGAAIAGVFLAIALYEVNGSNVETWYLRLFKDDHWRVSQTKGIAREHAASQIELALPQGRT
jgi:hypothetical protein